MRAGQIMIVRDAEKPADPDVRPQIDGVAADGSPKAEELIVRGWQRSGGLGRLFAPRDRRFVDPHLATPQAIFASKVGHHSASLRPQRTVLEWANVVGLKLNTQHKKDDFVEMTTAAVAASGVVLVAWEHQDIPSIGNRIVANSSAVPQS